MDSSQVHDMKEVPLPPRFFRRCLRSFCHPSLIMYIEGDLEELYQERFKMYGRRKADVLFIIDVILLFRPGIIKPLNQSPYPSNHYAMFSNNFKIALRSLWKNRLSSSINIFGLTIGLSSCLLIALYIQHEASYDSFHPNGDRIARLIMTYSFDGSTESNSGNYTSAKVAPVFVRTFPEVESAVRMTSRKMVIRSNDNLLTESHFLFADSTFFKIFKSELLQGNPAKVLDGPNKVILTASTAKRYFGTESPIGKTLLAGSNGIPYEITGVINDYPSNSQIQFDFLASFSSLGDTQEKTYFNANYTTYLLLHNAHSFSPLQEKVTPFMKKEMAGSGASIDYYVEPFLSIHLYSEHAAFVPNTSIKYLYILSAVAFLILAIVCFTYINLSTARSIDRAKEVGIRKSVGAARAQLFWQFIGESAIICMTSVIVSISVVALLLPFFNQLIDGHLSAKTLYSPEFLILTLAITLLVSVLAGSYPAVLLSGFQPATVLKGVFKNSSSGKFTQQALIVFQFAISVFLIVATLIIQKQLYFIQHEKLGYNRDHVLVLPMNNKMLSSLALIKHELKSNSNIISVSRCVSTPVQIQGGYGMRSANMTESEVIAVTANPVDEDYIKTTGLQILTGKDFTEQDINDAYPEKENPTYHYILNERAASELGWAPEEAIGKKMFLDTHRPGIVSAVIKDFHFQSLHHTIRPLVLFTETAGYGNLLVKVSGKDLPGTISFIEKKWKQIASYMPFEYQFMDDEYNRLYESEQQLGMLMNLFAGIAIILACLGLFGLSSYIVQQRIKEIGIRKILGASLLSIVGLLSGNFTKLVVAAIIIACPLAYWTMKIWLQDFAYRIDIPWWVFGVAGFSCIGIALLTVSIQSIKAALANPTESLKAE